MHNVKTGDADGYDDCEHIDECEFEWAEGFEVHGVPFCQGVAVQYMLPMWDSQVVCGWGGLPYHYLTSKHRMLYYNM